MTTRTLPPEEWPRLAGTELERLWPHLHPDRAAIIVVEDEGEIVGCWAGMWVFHAEGVWTKRTSPAIARHLLRGMADLAESVGSQTVVTSASTPSVTRIVEKLGAAVIPGPLYSLSLSGRN